MRRRERRVFGSVRRLASGRWQVRYRDLTGVMHTGPHTFTSKTDAARYLALVEADLHRGAWADPKLGRIAALDELVQAAAHLAPERPADEPGGMLVARTGRARSGGTRRRAGGGR